MAELVPLRPKRLRRPRRKWHSSASLGPGGLAPPTPRVDRPRRTRHRGRGATSATPGRREARGKRGFLFRMPFGDTGATAAFVDAVGTHSRLVIWQLGQTWMVAQATAEHPRGPRDGRRAGRPLHAIHRRPALPVRDVFAASIRGRADAFIGGRIALAHPDGKPTRMAAPHADTTTRTRRNTWP